MACTYVHVAHMHITSFSRDIVYVVFSQAQFPHSMVADQPSWQQLGFLLLINFIIIIIIMNYFQKCAELYMPTYFHVTMLSSLRFTNLHPIQLSSFLMLPFTTLTVA